MTKKVSIAEKRKWLEEYESGKPVIGIANQNQCGTRAVQNALEDARRERDARFARSELLKEALHSHQDAIRDELNRIMNKLEAPGRDFAPLSWYEGDASIFTPLGKVDNLVYTVGIAKHAGRPSAANTTTVTDLLRQHLRNDRLWKLLVRWDKAYVSHIADRASLQRKTVLLLEQKTGYRMVDKSNIPKPFLYSYTAGAVVYEIIIGVGLGLCDKSELEDDLISDTREGTVKYRNSIMAEAPGNEEKCRRSMLDALEELIKSSEFEMVNNSYRYLNECAVKARQAAEEISWLGYLPGNCRVCRRLGM